MSLSGIETAQDLMNVLDAIYNNLNTYDTYSSLKLYYNDIQRTSTIFKVKEDNTESVVAVLSLEGISTETKNYLARLIKSSIVSGTEARVYDVAVGAYIGIDQLMKNICVSLGVSLSDSFADDNPQIYSELRGIIEKYYGSVLENNTPYMLRKYANIDESLESYKTFIPMNIIIEFAIYLNSLGLFNSPEKNYVANLVPDHVKFSELPYNKVLNKYDFKNNIKDFFTVYKELYAKNDSYVTVERFMKAVNTIFEIYDTEIRDDTLKFICFSGYHTSSAPGYVKLFEIDKNCYFETDTNTNNTFNSYLKIGCDNNFIIRDYMYYESDGTTKKSIIENKASNNYIVEFTGQIDILGWKGLSTDYYFKTFAAERDDYKSYGSIGNIPINKSFDLSLYDKLNINELKLGLFSPISSKLDDLISHFSISFSSNDFIEIGFKAYNNNGLIENPTELVLFIIRDCKQITISNSSIANFPSMERLIAPFYSITTLDNLKYWFSSNQLYYTIDGGNSKGNKLDFNETTKIEVYAYKDGDYYSNTINTNSLELRWTDIFPVSFNLPARFYNIGSYKKIEEPEKLSGLSLIPDSVYPKDVVDSASFSAKYPDWYTYAITNPNTVSGVVDGTNTGSWGACSISKSVKTQSDAQNALIMTDDINNIIKDMDKAIDDDDEEDDPIDPEKDPDTNPNDDPDSKDKGDTPSVEDINNLPNILGAGAVKQYMLTASQLSALMSNLNSDSIWTALSKFISNPMNFIISLQAGYLYQHTGAVPNSYIKFGPYTFESCQGTLLNSNFCDINLGTVNLNPYFNNYTDITETSVSLYLPYVGYVDLDVSKFINGSIKLHARIDTLTGSIIYYVYSIRDGHEQLLNTFDGNCQMQIPINSADYSRMYAGLFGTATAAVGGASVATKPIATLVGDTVSRKLSDNEHIRNGATYQEGTRVPVY